MKRQIIALAALVLLAAGCPVSVAASSSVASDEEGCAGEHASATSASGASPWESLHAMDGRAPLHLLPMMANHQKVEMREHLEAVQEIVDALARDDLAAVASASAKIGFSDDEAAMCNHMGAATPGFTERALAFHHTADEITAAAKDGDKARALSALSATLLTCTGCHASYKQSVVDDAKFEELGGTVGPMHGEHPGTHGGEHGMR